MNRRMREPFHTLMWKASIGYNDSWSQVDPEVLEKFAESIVRECMLCCERVISDPVRPESVDTWLNGGLSCINEIKEHFGVE